MEQDDPGYAFNLPHTWGLKDHEANLNLVADYLPHTWGLKV